MACWMVPLKDVAMVSVQTTKCEIRLKNKSEITAKQECQTHTTGPFGGRRCCLGDFGVLAISD